MVILPRSSWTKSGPARPVTRLVSSEVFGIAVHWPGTAGAIGDPGQRAIAGRLEGYRTYHVDVRGWSDIAYNYAIDQAGRVWHLRGLAVRSAANGDEYVNRKYLAVLFLVGPGEHPTDAMLASFSDLRKEITSAYARALAVQGHMDVRTGDTQCPGPIIEALVKAGALVAILPPKPTPVVAKFVLRRHLSYGTTGKDVATLQRRINTLRSADIRVDGDFGPITKAAVKALQRKKWPLRPSRWDGIVGPLTAVHVLGWEYK